MNSGVGGRIEFFYNEDTNLVEVEYIGIPKELSPEDYESWVTGSWCSRKISLESGKKMIEGLLGR